MAITTTYNAKTELDTGAARLSIRQPLATYDSNAHIFRAEITRAGETVDLTGATCIGYFVRADGVTVPIDGAVESNAASVTLAPSCYAVPGRFDLAVKLTLDDVVHTVMQVNGTVEISQTDSMTSPGDGVQSFDKLAEAASKVIEYDLRITAVEVEADRIPDTVRVNLASTAAASFNGMANITPGVTGVLPLGNGGTGATDAAGARTKLGVPSVEEMQQRDRVANLLDNSWFVNPINQRGLTSFAGVGYFIDRWASWAEDNHLNLNANGITVTKSLIQGIACDNTKTYTAAVCLADGSIYVGTGIPKNEDFGVWNKVWVTKTEYGVIFYLHAESEQTYRWAALYEGAYTAETLPAYVYKGYAAELAECQRYYWNSKGVHIIHAIVGSTKIIYASIITPVPMRIAPSISISARGTFYPGGLLAWLSTATFTVSDIRSNAVLIKSAETLDAATANTVAAIELEFSLSADL